MLSVELFSDLQQLQDCWHQVGRLGQARQSLRLGLPGEYHAC